MPAAAAGERIEARRGNLEHGAKERDRGFPEIGPGRGGSSVFQSWNV